MEELRQAVQAAAKELYKIDIKPLISWPDEQFGDYATNAALQLAKQLDKKPHDIAVELSKELTKLDNVESAEPAGPGFINIRLSDKALLNNLGAEPTEPLAGQQILVEFGDPNPFKEMHIGHLYSYVVGDSLCRLLETRGAKVVRLSYHGDVGLHVAKAIWGMQQGGGKSVGDFYAAGSQAYEDDEAAKKEIDSINQHIYKHDDEAINKRYQEGKEASFAEFDEMLNMLSIKTDQRYLEGESAEVGIELVKSNTGKVFEESDGAIVYKGEQDGLHTRVFITSKGLPTYETKDLGLAVLKDRDYPKAKRSIYVTANEQAEYFKVMFAALAKIKPELAAKSSHLTHGFVSLSTGKMSSRRGQVFTAKQLIDDVAAAFKQAFKQQNKIVELGAVKFGFLKHRLGQDISYNPEESVSLQGDSGPYLQYAHARACSILAKAGTKADTNGNLEPAERSLARKIGQFPEVVEQAADDLLPSHITTYLYELAQVFNSFYESNRVIGDPRQAIRLKLTGAYAGKLKQGLNLLGIEAPDHI